MSSPIPETVGATTPDRVTVPWGISQTVIGFLFSFGIYLAGVLVVGSLVYSLAGQKFIDRHMLALDVLFYQFLVVGVAAVALWLLFARFHAGAAALGFRFPGWQTLLGTAAIVPGIFVAIFLFALVFDTLAPGYHLQGNSNELLPKGGKHIGLGTEVLVFAWAALEVPLTEETLFRGILYQGLRDFFRRWLPSQGAVLAGAVLSGMTFGIVHFEIHTLPILALLGIILAYVFQVTRSIYASALVHGLINAVAVFSVFHSA